MIVIMIVCFKRTFLSGHSVENRLQGQEQKWKKTNKKQSESYCNNPGGRRQLLGQMGGHKKWLDSLQGGEGRMLSPTMILMVKTVQIFYLHLFPIFPEVYAVDLP